MKKNKNQVVVPEVVEAPSSTQSLAQSLNDQWALTTASIKTTVKEVLKFGAMLVKVEQVVFAEGKAHNQYQANGGLESWLAANCPEVNYKTAMRWKKIAENAILHVGCDAKNALEFICGNHSAVDKSLLPALQANSADLYEAKSVRQLSQMVFDFAADDREEKREAAAAKPLPKLKKSDEAKAIWNQLMQHITKSSVKDSIPLLGEKETQACYNGLFDVMQMLKRHLAEFKG